MAKDLKDTAPATSDAYTGMLAIALVALIVGCVLLYLDYSQYPDKTPPPPKFGPPQIVEPGAAPLKKEPEQAAPPPVQAEKKEEK